MSHTTYVQPVVLQDCRRRVDTPLCLKARTDSGMDDMVDAAHDRAQHSAPSALATMGGPSASSSLPDLTGLSTDEVRMPLQFVKHNNSMAGFTIEQNKLCEPESSLVVSFRKPFQMHVFDCCLQHRDKSNMSLLCEAHASLWAYLYCLSSKLSCSWQPCALHHFLIDCLLQMLRMILTRMIAIYQKMDNIAQWMDQSHATTQAAAHHLDRLSTLVSDVSLQTYQMLVHSGVHPTHAGLPAKPPAIDTEGTQAPATHSARKRRKTEVSWQQHLHKQRVAQLESPLDQQLDEQAAAPRPEPSAQASEVQATFGDPRESSGSLRDPLRTIEGLPGMTEPQAQARPGLPAVGMPAAATGVGNTTRPDIPGTGQTAPWTGWRGAYRNLSGDMAK